MQLLLQAAALDERAFGQDSVKACSYRTYVVDRYCAGVTQITGDTHPHPTHSLMIIYMCMSLGVGGKC